MPTDWKGWLALACGSSTTGWLDWLNSSFLQKTKFSCIWLHPATNPIFYAFLGQQVINIELFNVPHAIVIFSFKVVSKSSSRGPPAYATHSTQHMAPWPSQARWGRREWIMSPGSSCCQQTQYRKMNQARFSEVTPNWHDHFPLFIKYSSCEKKRDLFKRILFLSSDCPQGRCDGSQEIVWYRIWRENLGQF